MIAFPWWAVLLEVAAAFAMAWRAYAWGKVNGYARGRRARGRAYDKGWKDGQHELRTRVMNQPRPRPPRPPRRPPPRVPRHQLMAALEGMFTHWSSGRCWCDSFHRDEATTLPLEPPPFELRTIRGTNPYPEQERTTVP